MIFFRNYLSQIVFMFLLMSGCKEQEINNHSSPNFYLSTDSVLFDTIFTGQESTFRTIKIFNSGRDILVLQDINLKKGANSEYEINVNGRALDEKATLKIAAQDSAYLFVKANLPSTTEDSPVLIEDAISFLVNGSIYQIPIQAYGLNTIRLNNYLIHENTTLSSGKPYIIGGDLIVDKNVRLIIEAGAKLYFKNNAQLKVNGELEAKGDLNNQITFCGERLERIYEDEAGQWKGLWITSEAKSCVLNHCLIKNAIIGVQIDSVEEGGKLLLSNSILKNHQVAALIAYKGSVTAINNLFANCGQYLFAALNGGNYVFLQNTFAGYNSAFARSTPSVFISDNSIINPASSGLSAIFYNNIIWGQLNKELEIEQKGTQNFNIDFEQNLLKNTNQKIVGKNLVGEDPLFLNIYKSDFQLSDNSPAINFGLDLSSRVFNEISSNDINGEERMYPSDLGCYEK